MATRSNILVQQGTTNIYLYRHWDGYLAENGKDIANALIAAGNDSSAFVRNLLNMTEDTARPDGSKRYHYEITSEVHGDIEYYYSVKFDSSYMERSAPKIGFAKRSPGDPQIGRNSAQHGSIEAFVEAVNKAIAAQNRRGKQLAAEQPAVYGDFEPSPFVEIPAKAVAA